MIDPKEIRIGNLTQAYFRPGENIISPITMIDEETGVFFAFNDKLLLEFKDIYPIPLTEEWLLRFGFSCVDEVNRGFTKTINTPLKEKFYCSPVDGVCALISELTSYKDFILSIRVNQIHQLQNLFFALTGQELTPTK